MWLWALLPISLAVFGSVGIWVVFGIAVSNETVNVTAVFPFISTCGTYNPQSCIFSQICNICSFLAVWIVMIRFQQVRDYGCHGKANVAGSVLGLVSSLGISITGNFQQSVVKSVHLLGAFLAFFVGLAYFWVQVWLTYHSEPSKDRRWLGPVRTTCCSLCTVLILAMAAFFFLGYRSAAAACEWALVMIFFCLFALFAADFRHIDCHRLTVQMRLLSSNNRSGEHGVFGLDECIAETHTSTQKHTRVRT
ncbi:modulator of macroautophagy TMEM150B [Aplochiton taeniatus]